MILGVAWWRWSQLKQFLLINIETLLLTHLPEGVHFIAESIQDYGLNLGQDDCYFENSKLCPDLSPDHELGPAGKESSYSVHRQCERYRHYYWEGDLFDYNLVDGSQRPYLFLVSPVWLFTFLPRFCRRQFFVCRPSLFWPFFITHRFNGHRSNHIFPLAFTISALL